MTKKKRGWTQLNLSATTVNSMAQEIIKPLQISLSVCNIYAMEKLTFIMRQEVEKFTLLCRNPELSI